MVVIRCPGLCGHGTFCCTSWVSGEGGGGVERGEPGAKRRTSFALTPWRHTHSLTLNLNLNLNLTRQWLRGIALEKTKGKPFRSLFPLESNRLLFVSQRERELLFQELLSQLVQGVEEMSEAEVNTILCSGMNAVTRDQYMEMLVRKSSFDDGMVSIETGTEESTSSSLRRQLVDAVRSLAGKGSNLFQAATETVQAHAASAAQTWSAEQRRHLRRHREVYSR